MSVEAIARRSGDWWAIEVPAIPGLFTQAKRLDQVKEMVRDAAHLLDAGDVDVTVTVELPPAAKADVTKAKAAAAKLSALAGAQIEAAAEMRLATQHLRAQGLSVRDVAEVLQVSPQRVSQLAPTRSR